jgi:hypothetical protein
VHRLSLKRRSYYWSSNKVQISYSACKIGQLCPVGFSYVWEWDEDALCDTAGRRLAMTGCREGQGGPCQRLDARCKRPRPSAAAGLVWQDCALQLVSVVLNADAPVPLQCRPLPGVALPQLPPQPGRLPMPSCRDGSVSAQRASSPPDCAGRAGAHQVRQAGCKCPNVRADQDRLYPIDAGAHQVRQVGCYCPIVRADQDQLYPVDDGLWAEMPCRVLLSYCACRSGPTVSY